MKKPLFFSAPARESLSSIVRMSFVGSILVFIFFQILQSSATASVPSPVWTSSTLSSISPTCVSSLISATQIKTVCTYTGSDQRVTAPTGATSATVKAWGAGGGTDANRDYVNGGPGGYTVATLNISSNQQNYRVVVGSGGTFGTSGPVYGFGNGTVTVGGSPGGGLSGIFTDINNSIITENSKSRALVVAGGGGGHDWDFGDMEYRNTYFTYPSQAGNSPLSGGSTTMMGYNGTKSSGLGNGGGGYVGGRGMSDTVGGIRYGAGGSGYVDPLASSTSILYANSEARPGGSSAPLNPPNSTDADYISGVGRGGWQGSNGASTASQLGGSNGLVVIIWGTGSAATTCPTNSTGTYPNCVCGNPPPAVVDIATISPTCVSTRVSDTEIKTVCTYTGSDQRITAPTGATSATIKSWGGGASGQLNPGGAGGFSKGTMQVSSGDQFAVMVGQGGDMSEGFTALPKTYGFGGETNYMNRAGQGGGLSGVFYRGDLITPTSQSRSVVIAGGGGGGDDPIQGGIAGTPGNQLTAANSDSNGSPGLYGTAFQAAGGGGYLGGSQSRGGSGFVINTATGNQILTGNGTIPPSQNDGDYIDGVAVGIQEDTNGTDAVAGNGLVVIRWTITAGSSTTGSSTTGSANLRYDQPSNSCVDNTVCPTNSTGTYPNCVCGNPPTTPTPPTTTVHSHCSNKPISIAKCSDIPGVVANGAAPDGNKLYILPKSASGAEYDYELVQMTHQCWFSENLREGTSNYGYHSGCGSPFANCGSRPAAGSELTDGVGKLYRHGDIWAGQQPTIRGKGICPSGFHIPSDCEFAAMLSSIGATGTEQMGGWYSAAILSALAPGGRSGFDFFLGGDYALSGTTSAGYVYFGQQGWIWTSAFINITTGAETIGGSYIYSKKGGSFGGYGGGYGFSARCIADGQTVTGSQFNSGDIGGQPLGTGSSTTGSANLRYDQASNSCVANTVCPTNSTGTYPNCVCGNPPNTVVDITAISPTCTSTRVSDTQIKTVCAYTGSDQRVTAPAGATSATVKAWGAGGGGHSEAVWGSIRPASAGGYSVGGLTVNPGQQLLIVVGGGGKMNSNNPTYGGGGAGGEGTHPTMALDGSSGGGFSGVLSADNLGTATAGDALIIAGGGGAIAGCPLGPNTGFGGGIAGGAGYNNAGSGATQTVGGSGANSGALFRGGNGARQGNPNAGGGGGAGGGYFGGAGGIGGVGICSEGSIPGGGGGGSGYCGTSISSCATTAGSGTQAPNTSDVDFLSGIGIGGGNSQGGDGRVVILWTVQSGSTQNTTTSSNLRYDQASNSCVENLVCPAGTTKKPTPSSPVCFLTATPSTSPANTSLILTGYENLTGNCTLSSSATNTVPASPILPSGASTGLVVSSTVSSVVATTTATFTTTAQAASLLTCPVGAPTCSIGAGGVISCGCYPTGVTPPAIVTPAAYTCVSNLCAEGQYFCSAENTCKPAKESCSAITCNNNNTCEVGESCNCGDCTTGVLENTKDKCGLSSPGNEQLYCTKDSVVASNITFPFCLPACLDGQACTSSCNLQVGACCPAGSQWNSTSDACVPTTCGKGQFYCAAKKMCLPGGSTECTTKTCNNDGTCSGDESCDCSDCVNGGPDDKDRCSIIGGIQAMCSDDNLTDNLPGACCVPPEKWDTTTKTCTACSNTQAPAELKANHDQPYIACTGNGVLTDTHFRYRLTKKDSTDAPFVSDIFSNSTQVLHPKLAAGMYTVECFYGNATAVNTSNTATPHSCVKTIESKDVNANAVNGCSRIYAYKGSTLSDEMTSNTQFDATFRCGSRFDKGDETSPFNLRVGTNVPIILGYDTITQLFTEFGLGISLSSTSQNFTTGSTPVACAVKVGGGYSTNDYCRVTACVGNNCNVPQAFSVVHSGDTLCTREPTANYTIGCNPEAPEDIRLACVEMFQAAVTKAGTSAANGAIFRLSFSFNGTLNTQVECRKYPAGDPKLQNIYDNVACTALLDNGEFYNIYAADSSGNQINSLQTQMRTVERDIDSPKLEPIKYYTDSSLTTTVEPTQWSNKPVYAVAVCNDTPRGESLACACAPTVDTTVTTNRGEGWLPGVQHGGVDIGADLLRYTRVILGNLTGNQVVGVIDTAGNKSPTQNITASIDTVAPVMVTEATGTGTTRTISLTATDSGSKIWKASLAPTDPVATNTSGLIYRKGLKANIDSLTFDAECDLTPSSGNFANVAESATSPTEATVTIPDVNTTTEVVTYCIRDNAGNTTRGIYPVITDACFTASNMPTIPTLATYKGLMRTRWGLATDNQKYGYSFSENATNAACFRGILATNIQTLVTNQLTPKTGTTLTNWNTDRAATKANASVLNTNGYYYYKYTGSTNNILSLSTSPTDTGTKSVIVEGGDIHIKANMTAVSGQSLILIARKNSSGNGGNITIDSTVTNIDAVLIADGGAVKSADSTTPGERLTINGRIYSYNTRGGSLKPSGTTDVMNADTPKVFNQSGALVNATDFFEAQKQDLERLRPIFVDSDNTCSLRLNYYAYTTATLPLLLQRPSGYQGGNCRF